MSYSSLRCNSSSSKLSPVSADNAMTLSATCSLRSGRLILDWARSILFPITTQGLSDKPFSYASSSFFKSCSWIHGWGTERSTTYKRKRQRSMCFRKAMPRPRFWWAPLMRPGMSATTREISQWIQQIPLKKKPKQIPPSLLLASVSTFRIMSQCINSKAQLMLSLLQLSFKTPEFRLLQCRQNTDCQFGSKVAYNWTWNGLSVEFCWKFFRTSKKSTELLNLFLQHFKALPRWHKLLSR